MIMARAWLRVGGRVVFRSDRAGLLSSPFAGLVAQFRRRGFSTLCQSASPLLQDAWHDSYASANMANMSSAWLSNSLSCRCRAWLPSTFIASSCTRTFVRIWSSSLFYSISRDLTTEGGIEIKRTHCGKMLQESQKWYIK